MSEELFTEKTIAEFFGDLVKSQPDHPFIMYPDRNLVWSYKDFDERTDNMAKGLLAIGVKKGDHVGVWARNVPEWLTLMFATAKIGAVLVTINTNYKSHELEYLVKQSDMHTLAIVDGLRDVSYVDVLYELVPELKVQPRGMLKSARFPRLKNVVYLGQEKHRGMYTSMELFQLGENMDDEAFEAAKHTFDQNDVVNMQYTSGTTGFPKGVMLTSRNILNNGFYIGERQLFTKNDRVCVPVPLFHCFGCVLGIMAILSHGATAVMVEQFDPLIVLASIQKARATAVYGVPTMYIAELNHPMFSMFDMSSLRTGIMSGSLCPVELMKQVIEKMHMPEITIPYGLTEASPVFTMSGAHETLEHRVTTVGTGQPHIEIKIIDPETGKTVPPNTVGELCCRGYNVMKG
ncbi:MAG: AMP-binding protein, partial [Victivallales bacterium]|nr:AMP-binding protein [Victivallales bacterium]